MNDDASFRLFKGCTRPAMLLGVPMVPLLTVGIAVFLPALWFWMPLALLLIPIFFVMKAIAKVDEFRFRQWGLWLALVLPLLASRRFWDGCCSWSPACAKRDRRHRQWILQPPVWVMQSETIPPAVENADARAMRFLAEAAQKKDGLIGAVMSYENAAVSIGLSPDDEEKLYAAKAAD